MIMTLYPSEFWLSKYDWYRAAIVMLIPVLLAAGMKEPSATDPALPEAESFRTPLPDTIFESNRWRAPQPEKRDWRLPPPPPKGWRTPPSSPSEPSSSRRTIEIFPRYKSGNPSDFDMTDREEKPLIKLFEFGSK
jgi:hypothetical protein